MRRTFILYQFIVHITCTEADLTNLTELTEHWQCFHNVFKCRWTFYKLRTEGKNNSPCLGLQGSLFRFTYPWRSDVVACRCGRVWLKELVFLHRWEGMLHKHLWCLSWGSTREHGFWSLWERQSYAGLGCWLPFCLTITFIISLPPSLTHWCLGSTLPAGAAVSYLLSFLNFIPYFINALMVF